MIRAKCLIVGVMFAAAVPLGAGVRMKSEQTDVKSGDVTQHTVILDAGRVRVDMTGAKVNTSMMLLGDGDAARMITLDRNRNEYREIDKRMFQQMGQQMTGAMAQMQEQMKKMTPEQRAMMEKMMSGRMGQMTKAVAPAPTVYTAKGASTVNGFRCTQYEGMREGQKVQEVCAADPSQLDLTAADFSGFEKMKEFFAEMQKMMASSPFASAMRSSITEPGFSGFPVLMNTFRNGELVNKSETKEVKRMSFSDADFSVGNAKKVEMNMPGAPR